jgi:hypothetical protein
MFSKAVGPADDIVVHGTFEEIKGPKTIHFFKAKGKRSKSDYTHTVIATFAQLVIRIFLTLIIDRFAKKKHVIE